MTRTLLAAFAIAALATGCATEEGAEEFVESENVFERTLTKTTTKVYNQCNRPPCTSSDQIVIASGGGSGIHCDPTADECPELPIGGFGPTAMTSFSSTRGVDLAFAPQEDLRYAEMNRTTSTLAVAFTNQPPRTSITNVSVVHTLGRGGVVMESLLIDLSNGDGYMTEPGPVDGTYSF